MCWAEMGPHYDSLNKSVIPVVKNAAPKTPHPKTLSDKSQDWSASLTPALAAHRHAQGSCKPLAGASVRRDHEAVVKLQ
jgi:hypothetical protein